MFYFAYGSNMNQVQMQERCAETRFVKRAYLKDYRFVYDGYSMKRKGAVANIIEEKGNIVWGSLYEINKDDLSKLDRYEGYPTAYTRRKIQVRDDKGDIYQAIVYFRTPKLISKPSPDYRKIVIQGARECGLPEDYLKRHLSR